MDSSVWPWFGFVAFIGLLLAFDLGLLHRRPRVVSVGHALWLSFAYVALAGLFNLGVLAWRGETAAYEFLTGFLIEKSLSIDNVFVFVLIFGHFAVPAQYQYRVLFWGLIGALVMRGVMIALGAALIANFHWIIFVFGGFLVATGIKMLRAIDAKPDLENNRLVAFLRRRLRITSDYHGEKFFVRRDGVLWATPLFLVLLLIETTDVIFAVDSIPAIFAITQDPFIVYTANVFAILGLRALYFALAGIIHRFHYLKYGLALVLIVVGAKMILNAFFGEKFIPTEWALAITAALIFGSMAVSLVKTRGPGNGTEARPLPTGWVPGSGGRDRNSKPKTQP